MDNIAKLQKGIRITIISLCLVIGGIAMIVFADDDVSFAKKKMMISSQEFICEIADNNKERARGLMFRENIGEDECMLFIYDEPSHIRMWMKNTLIPLDMLFINPDGEIVEIIENTTPHSLEPVGSNDNVQYVIEIKGGLAVKRGFKVGDKVEL